MKRFRIDVLVESDRTAESLGMFLDGLLAQHRWQFSVKELSLSEVNSRPSFGEQVHERIRGADSTHA